MRDGGPGTGMWNYDIRMATEAATKEKEEEDSGNKSWENPQSTKDLHAKD